MLSEQTKYLQPILVRLYRLFLLSTFSRKLLSIFQPELGSIACFVKHAGDFLEKESRILDVGAGSQTYKTFFKHCHYEATDFCHVNKHYAVKPHFICDLNCPLPIKDDSYDAVMCIQVLEHIKYPKNLIKEFQRILKKNGHLFLVVPQGWGLHDEPHNYFNFTLYGIKQLLEQANFEITMLKPRGGYFLNLATILIQLPLLLGRLNPLWKRLLFLPLQIMSFIFFWLIFPPIAYFIDSFLDKEKRWTLGYACHCIKR